MRNNFNNGLEDHLLDDDINDNVEEGMLLEEHIPAPVVPQQSKIAPSTAFGIAIFANLPTVLLVTFAVSLMLPEGELLVNGKPLYDETEDQAYDYAKMATNFTDPSNENSGLNKNEAGAQDYSKSTANNILQDFLEGAPLTWTTELMIALLVYAACDVSFRALRVFINRSTKDIPDAETRVGRIVREFRVFINGFSANAKPGAIDLENTVDPDLTLARAEDINDDGQPTLLDVVYVNLVKGNAELESTKTYKLYSVPHSFMNDKLFSWVTSKNFHDQYLSKMPSLADGAPLAAVAICSILAINLMEYTYSQSVRQGYFNQSYDDKWDTLNNGNKCGTTVNGLQQYNDDQWMDCDSQSDAQGAIDSTGKLMGQLGPFVQFLFWGGPIALALIVPLIDLIYKRTVGYDVGKKSPVYAFIEHAFGNLPKFLLLCLGVKVLFSGGFAAYAGKTLYDDTYAQAEAYALRSKVDGGLGKDLDGALTYAASTAKNIFVGFMNGAPLTWSIRLTTTLLIFAALDAAYHSYCLWQLKKGGVVLLDLPLTEKAKAQHLHNKKDEIAVQRTAGYTLPAFIGPYVNQALLSPELRDTWGHKLLASNYNFTHDKFFSWLMPKDAHDRFLSWMPSLSDFYYPVSGSILFALTAGIMLNIYTSLDGQKLFNSHYKTKHDAMTAEGHCISDNQQMDCRSISANDGVIYALQDFMKKLDGTFAQVLFWGPVAAAAIPVVFALARMAKALYHYVKTNPVDCSAWALGIVAQMGAACYYISTSCAACCTRGNNITNTSTNVFITDVEGNANRNTNSSGHETVIVNPIHEDVHGHVLSGNHSTLLGGNLNRVNLNEERESLLHNRSKKSSCCIIS